MKREGLAVGIILLLIGTCIIPSTAQQIENSSLPPSRGNWFYVGGSGPGNYSKIQDAIDNASDGDTVFVYDESSPYVETLTIIKSISLVGENKETTIIDGCGSPYIIILQVVSYVQLRGFTIRNSSRTEINWNAVKGVGIRLLAASFCTLSDNIITDTTVGIHLLNYLWNEFTYNNTISQNVLTQNTIGILLDWGSGDTTILQNELTQNWYGIVVITTQFNSITKNNFLWNGSFSSSHARDLLARQRYP
jgi:parallel beta-helix repeat protein